MVFGFGRQDEVKIRLQRGEFVTGEDVFGIMVLDLSKTRASKVTVGTVRIEGYEEVTHTALFSVLIASTTTTVTSGPTVASPANTCTTGMAVHMVHHPQTPPLPPWALCRHHTTDPHRESRQWEDLHHRRVFSSVFQGRLRGGLYGCPSWRFILATALPLSTPCKRTTIRVAWQGGDPVHGHSLRHHDRKQQPHCMLDGSPRDRECSIAADLGDRCQVPLAPPCRLTKHG